LKRRHILLSLLVAVLLVLGLAAPALASSSFTDAGDSPYESSINNLSTLGIVGGYDDGSFRPDNPLWRAQFAKMAVAALFIEVGEDDICTFDDAQALDPDNPLYPNAFVAVAAQNGIIRGYPDNTFRFWNRVTRQQVITMVVRAAGDNLAEPEPGWQGVLSYADPDHGENIKKAEFNGLLGGIANLPAWDPRLDATRGEAAEIVYRLLDCLPALEVSGHLGTEVFSLPELMAMTPTAGFGGLINRLGNITGPFSYTGVPVEDLLAQVGGGAAAVISAADGYTRNFSADDLAGGVAAFDPLTGDELDGFAGGLTLIVAYLSDGVGLGAANGPLRMAYVSPDADQVTGSGYWVKQTVQIEAAALELHGPGGTMLLSLEDLMAMPPVEGFGGMINRQGIVTGPFACTGVSVQALLELVGGGDTASVHALDGYSRNFSADDLAGGVPAFDPLTGDELDGFAGGLTLIVAYLVDGDSWAPTDGPLRMAYVSPDADQVTGSGYWVKQTVRIAVPQ